MSDLRFCAECACGYEWQPGWGGLCGGCRRAEILERERDVALDRITALEAEVARLRAERDWALEAIVEEFGGTVEDVLADARAAEEATT